MITLFRRIRQKLIESGSITKYLLYAAGEILLVVIGILIALQVNNWNEERKFIAEEVRYVDELILDLVQDSLMLEDFRSEALEVQRSKAKLVEYLDGVYKEPDSLRAYFADQWAPIATFTPVTTTIDEMKSGNGLGLIRDSGLRRKIVSHYNYYITYDQEESVFASGTKELFRLARIHLQNINQPEAAELIAALKRPEMANAVRTNYATGRLEGITRSLTRCSQLLSELKEYRKEL
ncbi:DUF6090 family protein [Balneola sp. MJW-20]|uniref:DUF6090 family protein n=1 Tax=Gracilimonas aurantiaca TaxID=3234185 RepID=UPI003466744E